jgi:hypothetical protein
MTRSTMLEGVLISLTEQWLADEGEPETLECLGELARQLKESMIDG